MQMTVVLHISNNLARFSIIRDEQFSKLDKKLLNDQKIAKISSSNFMIIQNIKLVV
jgi:hypothetical protein